MKAGKILGGLIIALGVLAFLSVIIVKEVNQAIILQFGDPKRIITKPGLNFKIPFIQNVVYLDKRILNLDTPPEEVKKINPDGILLSNGPGDPAAATYAINNIKELLSFKPIFGICLGHQILSLALGMETFK